MVAVGVIGVGSMGQNHARVFAHCDDARLLAISDPCEEQLMRIAKRHNVKTYTDYRRMIVEEPLDAVSIAVPTTMHKEVALFALTHKKHVLLEKPIAHNTEDAQAIIDAARNNNVKLMIGHIERFNPAILELKRRLPDLGEVYKIDVQRIGPFPVRVTDVGVIIDLSVHDLDIINYLLNDSPRRIYAETQQKLHPFHEDSVTALIKYQQGTLAVLNINYLSPVKTRLLKVFGKRGMFMVDYLSQELFFYENPSSAGDSWESVSEGDMRKINIARKEPLQAEIEAFLHCVRTGDEPLVDGNHALSVLALAHLLHTSAEKHTIIEV